MIDNNLQFYSRVRGSGKCVVWRCGSEHARSHNDYRSQVAPNSSTDGDGVDRGGDLDGDALLKKRPLDAGWFYDWKSAPPYDETLHGACRLLVAE